MSQIAQNSWKSICQFLFNVQLAYQLKYNILPLLFLFIFYSITQIFHIDLLAIRLLQTGGDGGGGGGGGDDNDDEDDTVNHINNQYQAGVHIW